MFLFNFDNWQPIDDSCVCWSPVVLLLLLLLCYKVYEVFEGEVGTMASIIIKHKLHGSSSPLLVTLTSLAATSLAATTTLSTTALMRLLEMVFELLTGSSLTSKILTIANTEFLRIETIESIAHVLHILVVEHLVEVEGAEVIVE